MIFSELRNEQMEVINYERNIKNKEYIKRLWYKRI